MTNDEQTMITNIQNEVKVEEVRDALEIVVLETEEIVAQRNVETVVHKDLITDSEMKTDPKNQTTDIEETDTKTFKYIFLKKCIFGKNSIFGYNIFDFLI